MKNLILKSTMFLGVAVLMAFHAQAQTINVSIPFAFDATGKNMPAGEYRVSLTSSPSGLYVMRNLETRDSVALSATHTIASSGGSAKLVFMQGVDGYHLIEVWDADNGRAVSCSRCKSSFLAGARVVIGPKK
jgi:hypothetical protein